MQHMTTDEVLDSYANLGPDQILDAIEQTGYVCDGRIFALNSYENRVYQIGIQDAEPIIVKFYRPARWSDEAILEEHRFTIELAQQEIPAIAPIPDQTGTTLHHAGHFRFALYPRRGGRPPELDNPEQLIQLGRFIGRIHNVGASRPFRQRPEISIQSLGSAACDYLLGNGFIPVDLEASYRTTCEDLIVRIRHCFERAGEFRRIRLHGDCHHGNILWRDGTPYILDFDDACTGPAVQDLWMLLSGDRPYMTARLGDLLEGYSGFRDFDASELHLVEALRTLRIMNYAAWLARRWDDPAFPRAFPYFNSTHYWQDHILTLREQAALMDEPPLEWFKNK